jgi:WhiB family redox-sensing transcriptional regulator
MVDHRKKTSPGLSVTAFQNSSTGSSTAKTSPTPQDSAFTDLLSLLQGVEWQERGNCRGAGPELFFSKHVCGTECNEVCQGKQEAGRFERIRRAKAACWGDESNGFRECPVRQECLDYALKNKILHGLWGGESERSRRRLAKPPKGE